jgi:hypothetical protein
VRDLVAFLDHGSEAIPRLLGRTVLPRPGGRNVEKADGVGEQPSDIVDVGVVEATNRASCYGVESWECAHRARWRTHCIQRLFDELLHVRFPSGDAHNDDRAIERSDTPLPTPAARAKASVGTI